MHSKVFFGERSVAEGCSAIMNSMAVKDGLERLSAVHEFNACQRLKLCFGLLNDGFLMLDSPLAIADVNQKPLLFHFKQIRNDSLLKLDDWLDFHRARHVPVLENFNLVAAQTPGQPSILLNVGHDQTFGRPVIPCFVASDLEPLQHRGVLRLFNPQCAVLKRVAPVIVVLDSCVDFSVPDGSSDFNSELRGKKA